MADSLASNESEITRVAGDLAKRMALVVSNTAIYGFPHSVTQQTVAPAFAALTEALEQFPELTLALSDEGLVANGRPLDRKMPAVQSLSRQLRSLDLSNFTLVAGVSTKEFGDLLEIISAQADQVKALGGSVKLVEMAGFEHVRVQKVTYLAVSEEEVVVSTDEVGEEKVEPLSGEDEVGQYLRSADAEPDKSVVQGVRDLASSTPTLGDLILDAAGIDVVAQDPEAGRALAQRIVRCLRKVYEALKQDPSFATQKGKKATTRSLKELQDHVLGEFRRKQPDTSDEDARVIEDAVEEMTDEVQMDGLAGEYARKRKAILENERRILRYMKARGIEAVEESGLRERLLENGLSFEEWSDLVEKAVGPTGGKSGGDREDVVPGRLGAMLANLQDNATQAVPAEGMDELVSMLDEIEREVNTVADEVEGRIDNLIDQVRMDNDRLAAKEDAVPDLSRDQMIETMAEIVQELCQPLSVINCSLGMVLSLDPGDMAAAQKEALKLASTSGERLNRMIERLSEISGLPSSLAPNKRIQEALQQ